MSFREDKPEQIFIHKERMDAADMASKSGSRQAPYDRHDYSDEYYKSPENEKSRRLEAIRKIANEAKKITTVIPAYLENEIYEEDSEGNGLIHQYTELMEKIVSLSGSYSYTYSGRVSSDSLSLILDNLQESIDEFRSQIEKILFRKKLEGSELRRREKSFEHLGKKPDVNSVLYKSLDLEATKEPFISILKEKYLGIEVLREKYGSAYKMYSDFNEWLFGKVTFDINSKARKFANEIKEKEKDLKNTRMRKEFIATSLDLRTLSTSSEKHFNKQKSLEFLYITEGKFRQFINSSQDNNPDLLDQVFVYERDRENLYKKLEEYFLSQPRELLKLELKRLRFVLEKDLKTKEQKLIPIFVKLSSSNGLTTFIDDSYNYALTYWHGLNHFNISHHVYGDDVSLNFESDAKKDALGELAIQKFTKSFSKEYRSAINSVTFSFLLSYFAYIKQKGEAKLVEEIGTIIDSIPEEIFFHTEHIEQMYQFHYFLEKLFVDTLDQEDVSSSRVEELIKKTKNPDNRKGRIDKIFQALGNKLQKRYFISSSDIEG